MNNNNYDEDFASFATRRFSTLMTIIILGHLKGVSSSMLNSIDRLLGASQKRVSHFRHSVVASEALRTKQQQMDVNGRKLVKACVTCWNSSYKMLDRLLKLRWAVTAVLSDEEVTKRSDRCIDLKSEQ